MDSHLSGERPRPSWVIEQTIDPSGFDCCGDQDLFPFRCSACSRPYVLCYECDTLYPDLPDMWVRIPFGSDARCPACGDVFGTGLMRSPAHRISFAEWSRHGLDGLLLDVPIADLFDRLCSSAGAIAELLSRGMLGTAKTKVVEFRNLAEAMIAHAPGAEELRIEGRRVAAGANVRYALSWHSTIGDPVGRAYGLLGITDSLFPAF